MIWESVLFLFFFAVNHWSGPFLDRYQDPDLHLLSNLPGICGLVTLVPLCFGFYCSPSLTSDDFDC